MLHARATDKQTKTLVIQKEACGHNQLPVTLCRGLENTTHLLYSVRIFTHGYFPWYLCRAVSVFVRQLCPWCVVHQLQAACTRFAFFQGRFRTVIIISSEAAGGNRAWEVLLSWLCP